MRREVRVLVSPPARTERQTRMWGSTGGSASGRPLRSTWLQVSAPQFLGAGADEQGQQYVGADGRAGGLLDQGVGLVEGQ